MNTTTRPTELPAAHCSPLDGGYTAVPWNGVTLNGIFVPNILKSVSAGTAIAVIGPDNKALKNEAGGVRRYADLEEARADVATLRRVLDEANV